MNRYPPFQGRGFGVGPVTMHVQHANTALDWATFALVVLLVLWLGAVTIAFLSRRGGGRRHHGRRMWLGPPGPRGGPDPLEILRMRFASGQITRDEFLQATGDLTSTAPTVEQPGPG